MQSNWYGAGNDAKVVYDAYAKFFHFSDINGNDSRTSHRPPIYFNNLAYGFSLDEGFQPAINTGPNDTVTVTLGPWGSSGLTGPPPTSIATLVNGSLVITDTSSTDRIRLVRAGHGDSVRVLLNGNSLGVFDPSADQIIINGLSKDQIDISRGLHLDVVINGVPQHDFDSDHDHDDGQRGTRRNDDSRGHHHKHC
jgi:hypothetical protein